MEPLALLLAASLSVSVSNAQKVTTVNLKAWRKKWVSNTKHYLVFVEKAFAQLLQKYQETIAFLALYNTLLLSIATWLYQSLVRKRDNLTVIFTGKEELKAEKESRRDDTLILFFFSFRLIDALLDTIVQRELVTGFHIHAQLVSTEIFQPQYLCRTAVCVSLVIFAMSWVWEIQKSVQR